MEKSLQLEERVYPVKIISKHAIEKGIIFTKMKYYVTLQLINTYDSRTTKPQTIKTSIDQYCNLEEGQLTTVKMYSPNGDDWYFTRDAAEAFSE